MKKDQNGIAHVGLIVLAVVVLLIGVSGWFVYSRNTVEDTVSNIEPTVATQKTEERVEPIPEVSASSYEIKELGTYIDLEPGWTVSNVREPDFTSVNAITNPNSPITIVAFTSESPAGFEGCMDDEGMVSVSPYLIADTEINDVIVFGADDGTLALANSSTAYASLSKSLTASKIKLSDLKVGTTYYRCSQASVPVSWTVDFDSNNKNNDGVYTHTGANTGKISDMTGYESVIKMLKSVSRK